MANMTNPLGNEVVFKAGSQSGARWPIGRFRGQYTINENIRGQILIGDLPFLSLLFPPPFGLFTFLFGCFFI